MNQNLHEPARTPRILIVEDEQIVALDLERNLTALGYSLAGIAETGRGAVRMARETNPDLVLMDVKLRGAIDGFGAADEIRRERPVPVVYITAYSTPEILERAKATQPLGFLVKPFRPNELNATIAMALHQHRITQQVLDSRASLRAILRTISDGVIATDTGGVVQFLNPAAEQLTGWRQDEAIGKPVEEVYSLVEVGWRATGLSPVRNALATGTAQRNGRFLMSLRNGSELPVEASAAPLTDPRGTVAGAVAVFKDISDRLRVEQWQAEERERLEGRVLWTEHALGETRAELRGLAANLITAQEDERRRLSRDLHDDFSQTLALIEMEAEGLRQADLPDSVQAGLERIIRRTSEVATGLRTLSHLLHPSLLENLGLVAALRALVDEYHQQGLEVSFASGRLSGVPPVAVATGLYRIAQEALHNVLKHATGASVRLQVIHEEDELRIVIEDSGSGFDVAEARAKGGLGLLSMQERARLAGGSLLIRTRPGDGTLLLVRVPLRRGA